MANAKEIKTHMKSVQDTQKITNAMYLISSTKMRKAKEYLDKTLPYFLALRHEIKRIFQTDSSLENRYFYPANGSHIREGTYACLVVTADKGLAGAYNMNVLKEADKLLADHPDTKLFVVGEYGRQYYANHHIPIERSFLYTAQNPTMARAREICDLLLDLYDRGEVVKIFIVYTDIENSLNANAISTRLLPFHRSHFLEGDEKPVVSPFEFAPSMDVVLDSCMHSYVGGFIYSALVDSFCSEQNARMTAMKAANDNAEELLGELSVQYNQVRQGAITQEITEVSAGANAQKKKKKEVIDF